MRPIIEIKDGLVSSVLALAFLLGLNALVIWLADRFSGGADLFALFGRIFLWFIATVFILACYFPVSAIRHPKCRSLVIEGDQLVWRVRREGAETIEERLPLREIQTLEFVSPKRQGRHAMSTAQLFFVTTRGERRELPMDFFPAVYRRQIEAAIRLHVPQLQVVEQAEDLMS